MAQKTVLSWVSEPLTYGSDMTLSKIDWLILLNFCPAHQRDIALRWKLADACGQFLAVCITGATSVNREFQSVKPLLW